MSVAQKFIFYQRSVTVLNPSSICQVPVESDSSFNIPHKMPKPGCNFLRMAAGARDVHSPDQEIVLELVPEVLRP